MGWVTLWETFSQTHLATLLATMETETMLQKRWKQR
jgi:hypothetical protein